MIDAIKVLVVDDSALMRKKISEILESDPSIKVAATARNGEDGVIKARELRPDVVTMDINMPVMDGIEALIHIIREEICPVVMVSSLTTEEAEVTLQALEIGAFDYVPKPGGTISLNIERISSEIISKVKAAAKSKNKKKRKKVEVREKEQKIEKIAPSDPNVTIGVAIGISTGGPKTLTEVIPLLPFDLGAAVFLVQHMPAGFTEGFAKRLDSISNISVKEVQPGDIIYNNCVYLGKAGYHFVLRKRFDAKIIVRTPTAPESFFMPSVDIMMRSAVDVFQSRLVGVLMTGMGDDGADAMVEVKKNGGITIAESEDTAVVFGMPKEAISKGCVDIVAGADEIASRIVESVENIKYRVGYGRR